MTAKEASGCFHCHLPIPNGFHQTLEYQGKNRQFCCMGCYSIADTIISSGLDDYYKFRTSVAPKADDLIPEELKVFDEKEVIDSFVKTQNEVTQSIELICENLQCSACSWLIEKHIGSLKGVRKVAANVSEQTIYLTWSKTQTKLSDVLISFHQLGYPVKPYNSEQLDSIHHQQNKLWLKRLGLAGLGMMQVMMYAVALYIGAFDGIDASHQSFLRWVSFFVATPVLLYSGYPFFSSAIRAIKSWQLNMDVPIALALALAYITSIWATISGGGEVYFDSVTMFVFFLLIGRYLEYNVRQKVRQQFTLKTSQANLLVNKVDLSDSAKIKPMPLQKISIGDKLLIKPGDVIAFDGVIYRGTSSINEAMLSGEFMPVNKTIGDSVLAGSINGDAPIEIEVLHLKDDGFLHQLKQMQRIALLAKPKITMLADKVARYFVTAILLLALATFSFWYFKEPAEALWITIAVLVVSCPCALSLATPVALTCGVSSLNKRNFLVQDQDFLQKLSTTTDIIFDKTGTLTQGKLVVESVELFSAISEPAVLQVIAALEAHSEHPIAKAFAPYSVSNVQASDIELHPYAGVTGQIDKTTYWFGNANFISNYTQVSTKDLDANGLFLCNSQQLTAKIILTDAIREDVKQSLSQLIKGGKTLHLLSGDPSQQVEQLATEVGIEHWRNNLKPEDKLDYITKLKKSSTNKEVLMIGDGVNDAPAMAFSDTSIAMAGASDLTKTHADSYLLSAQLSDIEFALNKSLQTNSVIKQNLGWAICYNLIMIPFAASGLIPPYLAAIGMSLSSIVVVINSLRLNPKT
ncbi:MAG: cadmium-translocating P-type ATPase [Gammaproteobacteria bacterium]|nr:cadmium-translocating P-type ATPase [Gammaproteobacteria bacterium]